MWISVDAGYDKLFPDEIDCGDNEELFFALTALRDDTDKNQWIIEETIKQYTEKYGLYMSKD